MQKGHRSAGGRTDPLGEAAARTRETEKKEGKGGRGNKEEAEGCEAQKLVRALRPAINTRANDLVRVRTRR